MARIRTIKPDFFRHEKLQDLEIANPGMYPMMVFEGLWGHCDSKGRFEWKPRTLKLDILPFLPFDMAETLAILENAGMLHRYSVDGKEYGLIDTFEKHQRLSGKELTEGEKFPAPMIETTVKQQGSVREIPESQEGKGREEEKEGKGKEFNAPPSAVAVIESEPEPVATKSETALQAACRETWAAYCQAYADAYGAQPVRAAKQSSQVKQIVQSLGADEAPQVVAWFVRHPAQWYVTKGHDIGLLLADIVKLRTEWATGRVGTATAAKQSDRRGAMASAVQNLLAECGGAT